jgi:anti-sigma B factor antagonist
MELTTREAGEVLILEPVDKRLDALVAPSFKDQLVSLIDGGRRNVLLDLRNVGFVDSAGLGAIVAAIKHIGRDGELKVCGAQPTVRSMFELTRLHRIISIFASESEGVARFAG